MTSQLDTMPHVDIDVLRRAIDDQYPGVPTNWTRSRTNEWRHTLDCAKPIVSEINLVFACNPNTARIPLKVYMKVGVQHMTANKILAFHRISAILQTNMPWNH